MDHHRRLLGVVLSRVLQLEALRKVVVNLYRTQLPASADGILNHEVELRTIESGLAVFNLCLQAFLLAGIDDGLFALCPHFVGANVLQLVVRVAKRNLRLDIVEIEYRENSLNYIHHAKELALDLIGTAEDVSIVLSERPYASKSVKFAALLVTVNSAELGNAQRQVLI